jgi:hypothetical protein
MANETEPTGKTELTDEQRAELLRRELKRLRVADLAYDWMVSLVTVGYQKLGLTGETRELRDLDDAHLAIELLRTTIDTVAAEGAGEGLSDVRSTLAGMQLNYVRAVGEGEPAPAVPPEEKAEATTRAPARGPARRKPAKGPVAKGRTTKSRSPKNKKA